MECPLGGNGRHWQKFEIQGLEAEMRELTDEQQMHEELQKRNDMALTEACEEAAAQREVGRKRREEAEAARNSLLRRVLPRPRAMFDPPPALRLGGARMECVPPVLADAAVAADFALAAPPPVLADAFAAAHGPPKGCYNGQRALPAVVNAVGATRVELGLKLARIAKKQKRVAKSLANKRARLEGFGASSSLHSLANLELHSPRTMTSKREASELTQAETPPVAKRYRKAIDEVAEEYVCPITGQLPIDPVTAEDGRCYERCAIEEWFVRQLEAQVKSPLTNETMGKRLFPAVQLRNSLKQLVESGAISGCKADAWKKAMADEAEVAALRLAAEGGDANAMCKLGFSYREGTRGLKTDLVRSFMWFGRAADLKDVRAIQLCGYAYLRGEGVELDVSRGNAMIRSRHSSGP